MQAFGVSTLSLPKSCRLRIAKGRRRIVLKVFTMNVEPHRFYIQQGFVQTGADAEFDSIRPPTSSSIP